MFNRSKQSRSSILFRFAGILFLLVYLLLPFGNQFTRLLHHASHQIAEMVSGSEDEHHSHDHHAGISHAHHQHHAQAHNSEEHNNHAHPLLDFFEAFADFAMGSDEDQMTFKSVDKHLGTDHFFIADRSFEELPSKFPALIASTLAEHTYTVPMPPDGAICSAQF